MLAYQAGIAKFDGMETKVFAISTDNGPSQQAFAKQVNASFPFLTDLQSVKCPKSMGC
jgi:peroxiredoxin